MYSAFIDLVGIKDQAEHDPGQYCESLDLFQTILKRKGTVLGKKDLVYFFSDCAFIESSSAGRLLTYMIDLRTEFFLEGLYFKGAIDKGALWETSTARAKAASTLQAGTSVRGVTFGLSAARLVGSTEGLKGVGITISSGVAEDLGVTEKSHLLRSFYVPQGNYRQLCEYRDVRLRASDMVKPRFDRILRTMLTAKVVSRKRARYYLTPLMQWLECSSWEDHQQEFPEYAYERLLDAHTYSLFHDVVGFEYLYFTMLSRSLRNDASFDNKLSNRIWRFFRSHRQLIAKLDAVPSELLTRDQRSAIASRLTTQHTDARED